MRRLFRQFSFPGEIPSHASPETPGSINEGGELGYSLLHAYGAAFDNPDLFVCCVVGDEAETAALATSCAELCYHEAPRVSARSRSTKKRTARTAFASAPCAVSALVIPADEELMIARHTTGAISANHMEGPHR